MYGNKLEIVKQILLVVLQNSSLSTDVEISPITDLRQDLGLDSIGLAEFAVRIEDQYDVDVFEDGIVSTVQEVINKI